MRQKLDELLEQINNSLIMMGAMCEDNLLKAFRAFKEQDKELAIQVYKSDYEVGTKAREIESLCLNTLLRQQPVARDMLVVSATLKMVADVERINAQAADIAELISNFDFNYQGEDVKLMLAMADETVKMVKNSIDSFVKGDQEAALQVIRQDDIVDKYFSAVRHSLIVKAQTCQADNELSLDVLMIVKYLERIGDHSCNIARCVIYLVTGKINKSGDILA